jgi:hypothetical protein
MPTLARRPSHVRSIAPPASLPGSDHHASHQGAHQGAHHEADALPNERPGHDDDDGPVPPQKPKGEGKEVHGHEDEDDVTSSSTAGWLAGRLTLVGACCGKSNAYRM